MRHGYLTVISAIALCASAIASSEYSRSERATLSAQVGGVVGMYAGVAPNEYNQTAADLARKEEDIQRREQALARSLSEDPSANSKALNYIVSFNAALFLLLAANFYMDYRDRHGGHAIPGSA